MNTPSHTILNLAILRRVPAPHLTWPVVIGSWLPDAAIFVFFAWAKLAGIPDAVIWRETYYTPIWQGIFAIGNSIPLALLGWGLCGWQKWGGGTALFASMLLHHGTDIPLHHEDAHQHFWPLTDFRIISPVSYWDTDHYGFYGALVELSLLLVASFSLWRQVRSRLGKSLLLLTNLAYFWGYVTFYLPSFP
jgi:hypothetical protein